MSANKRNDKNLLNKQGQSASSIIDNLLSENNKFISQSSDRTKIVNDNLSLLLKEYNEKCTTFKNAVDKLSSERDRILSEAEAEAANIVTDARQEAATIITSANQYAKSERDKIQAHINELTADKKAWKDEKEMIDKTQRFESRIKLDIGGEKFTTSLTTLRRFPDTMIGAMFSGRHSLSTDEDGYYFIDRDGTYFRHILNFLRSPEDFDDSLLSDREFTETQKEAVYYGIGEEMFPFVPKEPRTFQVSLHDPWHRHGCNTCKQVVATANRKGIWNLKIDNEINSPAVYCPRCKAAFTVSASTNPTLQSYNSNRMMTTGIIIKEFFRDDEAVDEQPKVGRGITCPYCANTYQNDGQNIWYIQM